MSSENTSGGLMQCAGCGCNDLEGCPGGCIWAAPGLCSACALGRNHGPDEHPDDRAYGHPFELESEPPDFLGEPTWEHNSQYADGIDHLCDEGGDSLLILDTDADDLFDECGENVDVWPTINKRADTLLIVALRNALPALLSLSAQPAAEGAGTGASERAP